jgi:hypothetical protein
MEEAEVTEALLVNEAKGNSYICLILYNLVIYIYCCIYIYLLLYIYIFTVIYIYIYDIIYNS